MWLPVVLFIGGIALIVASVATGEADLTLVVIFPVVSGSGGLFLLGMIFMVAGLLLGFALMTMGQLELAGYQRERMEASGDERRSTATNTRYGGVVLLGPVPIAFGSNMRIAIAMLVIGIVVAVVSLALILVFLG